MNQHFSEKIAGKPRILIAPLDWGLGHATRCIPIIRELVALDCDVWLAGEGAQEKLLNTEFPLLPFLSLTGYRIQYAKTGRGLLWKMAIQWPSISKKIRKENEWLKEMIIKYEFDAVISDNRYGLYHASIPSIFITHQLLIKSPFGRWSEKIIQKISYKHINHFTECWVPDLEGTINLSGALSHTPVKPSIPVHYIGVLSRCKKEVAPEKKQHVLIILSGPEPQRSILETKLIEEISHYNGTATIVRGLPGSDSMIPSTNMIQFYNHLPAGKMNKEMTEAAYIISRSGYSTVMDVISLHKKSILIPTPGQTEQEYLARYLMSNEMAIAMNQTDFSIHQALKLAEKFSYRFPLLENEDLLQKIITGFVSALTN